MAYNLQMITTLKYLAGFIIAIAVLDLSGYLAWQISGQTPLDPYYIGTLTNILLSFII